MKNNACKLRRQLRSNSVGKRGVLNDDRRFAVFDAGRRLKALAVFFSTWLGAQQGMQVPAIAAPAPLTSTQRILAETWRIVDRQYVDRTFDGNDWFAMRQEYVRKRDYKDDNAAYQAANEMLAKLHDPYTRFLTPNKYQTLVNSATGELDGGIGVTLMGMKEREEGVLVVDVEDSSPASEAGLSAGDILEIVDGDKAYFDNVEGVAARLRGLKDSKVGVVVSHPDGTKEELFLIRRPLKIIGVKSRMSRVNGKKVGIIRVKTFSGNTADEIKKALTGTCSSADEIIVDLRGNVGGLLPGGIDSAALFLKKGDPIVSIVDKVGQEDRRFAFTDGIDLDR